MTTTLRAFATAIAILISSPADAQVVLERPLGPVLAIAHRGASYFAPEHTLFAYDLAMALDVDMIECDLQLTKDGVLVCIHDTTVDRTSNGSGRVDSFTFDELRQLDFGSWFNTANPARAKPDYVGAKIVSFEEQLSCYLRHNPRIRIHVETKAPAEYGGKMEPALVNLLTRLGLVATGNNDVHTSTIVIQSFDLNSLQIVKSLAPTLPTAYLFSAPTDPLIAAGVLPAYVDAAAPTSAVLRADPGFVSRVHQSGKAVHTWTVDSEADMDYLMDVGIDGIFSNRSDLVRARIDARGMGTSETARNNPIDFARLCQFPDLAIAGAVQLSPAKVTAGGDVTFSAAVSNVGTGAAQEIGVRFLVDGVTVGTDRTIATLAPGASITVTSDKWSAKHRLGQHSVEVRVDSANAIVESNEMNNSATQAFAVPGAKL
jgi:glycerophosphoryl diester phosphodiesterase